MSEDQNKDDKLTFWKKQIAVWRDSGISGNQWTRENNVTIDTFRYWKKKVEELEQTIDCQNFAAPKFVEIAKDKMQPTSTVGIQLEIHGLLIHLQPYFDESTLQRVLKLLGGEI